MSTSPLITLALVSVVIAWATRKRSGRARYAQMARWIAIPTLTLWCGYAAFYVARANAKSDDVRAYYARVHPVLRVARDGGESGERLIPLVPAYVDAIDLGHARIVVDWPLDY